VSKITGMEAGKIDRRLVAAAIVAVALYVVLAYLLAPFVWRHFERQPALAGLEATTRTALGLPGDAINVGLEGSEDDLLCAMHAAGWRPADPVTLSSSVRIVGSVLLDRPYLDAPVSPLFYDNRKQDLAFEKPSGKSARTRHHVRFWKALDAGEEGLPVWLGAAVYDNGLGVSHYTGQITHHTAPDIDAERDLLMSDLTQAKKVAELYSVSGVGPTLFARNGEGDPYFTDGDIAFAKLVSGCEAKEGAPRTHLEPPRIEAKNAVFSWLVRLWRTLHDLGRPPEGGAAILRP
jgi:LssY C-terminus